MCFVIAHVAVLLQRSALTLQQQANAIERIML
jgi:hypothetical protein